MREVIAVNIQILSQEESFGLLGRSHLARIACVSEGQPYIVPINYVLDSVFLYSFSTFGQKIEWMRANPRVCVEIDDIAHSRNWESVIATGHYEELLDTPECKPQRDRAWSLLQAQPNWWQPGYVKTVISGVERPLVPIFFRIRLEDVTGHRLNISAPQVHKEKSNLSGFLKGLLGDRGASSEKTRQEKAP